MSLVVGLILLLYLVPFIKVCHLVSQHIFCFKKWSCLCKSKMKCCRFVMFALDGVGLFEYWIFPFRRCFLTIPLCLILLVNLGFFIWQQSLFGFWHHLGLIVAALLGLTVEHLKIFVDLNALELLKIFPQIHPKDFLRRYRHELAFGGCDFFKTEEFTKVTPLSVNFRKEIRSSLSWLLPLKCLFDTYYLSQMALCASRRMGSVYFQGVFDLLASVWGKRMLELSRAYLTVTGSDQLLNAQGRLIFVFNHKSLFDLAVVLFAFSDTRLSGRRAKLRFVLPGQACRAHRCLLWITGLSKVYAQVPMFCHVDDPQINTRIAEQFVLNDFDLALFPQGQAAKPNFDRAQKRRDAGYFTTLSRLPVAVEGELQHLQGQSAKLVSDILQLRKNASLTDDIHVVFAGIKGTANILPRNAYRIQTECEIQLVVGPLLNLNTVSLDDHFQQHFLHAVDESLQGALGVRGVLAQRYLTELKGQFKYDDSKIDQVRTYLAKCAEESDVVFQVLDGLYALPVPSWNPFLSQLSQLLLERAPVSRFLYLLEEINVELQKT